MLVAALTTVINGQNYTTYQQQDIPSNFIRKSAFHQEIARLDITVDREGVGALPIALVPRVQKNDILRVRMLDEAVNGIKPDESFWDWNLVVAYVNPARNELEDESVSREVNFRKEGWYKEHLFKVPYDSQPVFFLYPKRKYRKKIRKLISRDFDQIRKIGEKTLEIAGAYAQIGMFLNQLQQVINTSPFSANSGYGGYSIFGSEYTNQYMQNQFVERLAQSFNISLPNCWNNSGNAGFYGSSNDFVSRAQCVAKNVRLEDFDFSVGRMLQQGGILAVTRLVQKYPHLAYWINVAAAAADLIIKITKKTPLRIVPTLAQPKSDGNNQYEQYSYGGYGDQNQSNAPIQQKISLFAEKSPTDNDFVTAFPIVLHKWQADPDPEVIALPVPRLLEPCLHAGANVLKNTDISYDWLHDDYARDFKLIMSAENGFAREFRLRKDLGISGWVLMINPQDMQSFPKIRMTLTAKIVATRGFNQIESEEFPIPLAGNGEWEISDQSKSAFAVGGKQRLVIKNTQGSCRCLQSVTYRPSFGGEFRFSANASENPLKFTKNGAEAWFDLDTTYFQPGQGSLEFRTFGIEQQPQTIEIQLYPAPPEIRSVNVHKGDNRLILEGDRLEQIIMLMADGKIATPVADDSNQPSIASERAFKMQDPRDKVLAKKLVLKLLLNGGREVDVKQSFSVSPARPTINSNHQKEIEGLPLSSKKANSQFNLASYPVVAIDTDKITLAVKSILGDYSFKAENLSIETRIENGQVAQESLPKATFEVLDTLNLRIDLNLLPQNQHFLAGRRLQFRILDNERGASDWYTIKQTFVRIPEIKSISCKNGECRIFGTGLDYLGQISTDSGATWQPPPPVQPTPEGKGVMIIRNIKSKSNLQMKLRDFDKTSGLVIH